MTRTVAIKIASILFRLLLGGIFIYASAYKIIDPNAFAHQIFNYKLLPWWLINPLAIILPWLQIICGILLIVNIWAREANAWILIMLVVFQAAVASALARGLNVSCGCFKAGGEAATWLSFGRDSVILIAAVISQVLLSKRNGNN